MNIIAKSIHENQKKFYFSMAALVLGLVGLILYISTGVIAGYTDKYSVAMIVVAVVGIITNILFCVKRINTVEIIPFVAYIVCIFLFLAINVNYLMAVVRAIDINSVSGSFVGTILLFLAASIVYVTGFAFKGISKK